jgi:hypothetical protein
LERLTTDVRKQQLRKDKKKDKTMRLEQFRALLHQDKERLSEEEQNKRDKESNLVRNDEEYEEMY